MASCTTLFTLDYITAVGIIAEAPVSLMFTCFTLHTSTNKCFSPHTSQV